MATPTDNTSGLTGNSLVDGLLQGSSWQFSGGSHILTYSFSLNDSDISSNNPAWNAALSDAMRQAFTEWSSVANVTFVEVGSGTLYFQSTADIAVVLTGSELQDSGAASIGIFPSPSFVNSTVFAPGSGVTRSDYPKIEGDIALDNYYSAFNYLYAGGLGLAFMLHEIGHALGLKHPFDDGGNNRPTFAQLGISGLDNTDYTVMSYTSPNGQPDYLNQTSVTGNPATFDASNVSLPPASHIVRVVPSDTNW